MQVGYGEWVRFHQKMPVWAPPVPSREVFPTEIRTLGSGICVAVATIANAVNSKVL